MFNIKVYSRKNNRIIYELIHFRYINNLLNKGQNCVVFSSLISPTKAVLFYFETFHQTLEDSILNIH